MSVIVCTHHKCASRFLVKYLQRFCKHNALTLFVSHKGDTVPDHKYDVNILTNATYTVLEPYLVEQPQAIHVIRNPLNVLVSGYFSHLRTHSTENWPQLVAQRRALECVSRTEGFYLTLEFLEKAEFYPRTPGPLRAMADWDYDDPRTATLRMEDVVADIDSFGECLLKAIGSGAAVLPKADNFAFERFSDGRSLGVRDEGSHYRSGSPDTWKEDLTDDLIRCVRERYHRFLTRFYPEVA